MNEPDLRSFPTRRTSDLGPQSRGTAPRVMQVMVGSTCTSNAEFEKKLFVIRKWAERTVRESDLKDRGYFYLPSLSANRSEEHTSELQSREKLVCRLLLEK